GLELLVGRYFALEGVGQVGRLEHRQHVVLLDRVAGGDLQVDGGGRGGIQGRADGGHHAAVDRGVAYQGASADFGDAHAAARDRVFAAVPGGEQGEAGGGQGDGAASQQRAALEFVPGRWGDDGVLMGCIANHGVSSNDEDICRYSTIHASM